jgi:hypothetical protein
VRCIHSCFIFEGEAIGILGSRRSSPFKTLRTEQIVKGFKEPRATRSWDKGWVPSVQEFRDCSSADEFKQLISFADEGRTPLSDLWGRAQFTWVNSKIFDLMDAERPQRAGKLAIDLMQALPSVSDEIPQLLTFLWAIENLYAATKVNLSEVPTSKPFNDLAQEVLARLQIQNKENQKSPSPDNESGANDGGDGPRGRGKSKKRGSPPGSGGSGSNSDSDSSASKHKIPGRGSRSRSIRSRSRSNRSSGGSRRSPLSSRSPSPKRRRRRSKPRKSPSPSSSDSSQSSESSALSSSRRRGRHQQKPAKRKA